MSPYAGHTYTTRYSSVAVTSSQTTPQQPSFFLQLYPTSSQAISSSCFSICSLTYPFRLLYCRFSAAATHAATRCNTLHHRSTLIGTSTLDPTLPTTHIRRGQPSRLPLQASIAGIWCPLARYLLRSRSQYVFDFSNQRSGRQSSSSASPISTASCSRKTTRKGGISSITGG